MEVQHQLKRLSIADVIAMHYQQNPKDHDIGLLRQSIREYGFVTPCVIDTNTNILVEGHGRSTALLQMYNAGEAPPVGVEIVDGEWRIPVLFYAFKDEQHRISYTVMANQSSLAGGWDEEVLAGVLQDIAVQTDNLLAHTGFDGDDLDQLVEFLATEPHIPPLREQVEPKSFHDVFIEIGCTHDVYKSIESLIDQVRAVQDVTINIS